MSFKKSKALFGGGGGRVDEDEGLSAVGGPGQLYNESNRGRADTRKKEKGGRDASRSRSRSSSVIRRLLGKKDKPKSADIKAPASTASTAPVFGFGDDCSVVSVNTTGTGGFRKDRPKVKKISKKTTENQSESSRRSNRTSDQGYDFRGFGEDDTSLASPRATPKIKKIKKMSKIKYKTHTDGMDSDGDYGMDSDGDGGVSVRSVKSEGMLSPGTIRKIRRKKKPKKDDDTCGSSKSSLNGDMSVGRNRPSVSRTRRKSAIQESPGSPAGKVLMNEMDDLYPSPKSTGKTKSLSMRVRSKPDIAVISFQNEAVAVRKVDKRNEPVSFQGHHGGNNSSDSFRKMKANWEKEQATAFLIRATESNSFKKGRLPLPTTPLEAESWRRKTENGGMSPDARPQPTSSQSYLSRGGESEAVLSLTETVTSLNKQLQDQREESKEVQKQLADALAKIVSMNENIRREEAVARKANAYLSEVREELGKVMDEKADLAKSVITLEDHLRAKEERIEKLQQVVETQLDTVEFLEDKLEKTEDELFKMEDEFKRLEDEGASNQFVHAPKDLDRTGLMDSIRVDRIKRKGSMVKQESVRMLQAIEGTDRTHSDHMGKRLRSSSIDRDIEERERKIVAREKQLDVQREEFDLREQRLEEWEQELLELDEQLKNGNDSSANERLLERRERKLEETREDLEGKKAEWTEKIRKLEEENRKLLSSKNSSAKDEEIKALQGAIEKLDNEKAELENSIERVNRMKDDADRKVKKLESDIEELRGKFGGANSASSKCEEERQKEIRKLKAEISTLRNNGGGSAEQDEMVRQVQEEITEQLSELDDENQKLNEKLLSETKRFEAELEFKDETIVDLQQTMEGLEKNLKSQDSGPYIASLLKELSDLKKKNRILSSMDGELDDALASLEQKDTAIKALEEKLSKLNGGETKSHEEDGKDLLIRELQNQLVVAKKDVHTLSSGDYVTRLKLEIKTLKTGYNELKKRLKKEEIEARATVKQKDESIQCLQKEIAAQKRELERREKREKNLGTDQKMGDENLQKHIEDLEDEIDHWKATNADLEQELDILKVEVGEWKTKAEGVDFDDDGSLGSVQSFNSHVSEQQGIERSTHSVSSLMSNDLFFVSNSNSVRGHRTCAPPPPPLAPGDEVSTPSQRARRTVSDLWSKLRSGPDPAAQANPAIPYGIGSLDDD